MCIGDFNEALSKDEQCGVSERGDAQMQLFRDCLEDCQLMDLGSTGPKLTWNNRQEGERNVRVRLDRVVANGQFIKLFNDSLVENIITTSSDHFAVMLSLASRATSKNIIS